MNKGISVNISSPPTPQIYPTLARSTRLEKQGSRQTAFGSEVLYVTWEGDDLDSPQLG